MTPKPQFISLEGGEGAGKSTQLKLLANAFIAAGLQCLVTREPGGSDGGEAIRTLVVSGAIDKWDPVTEALLFMTARYDHLTTHIEPLLHGGAWVICDRFYDSTYVYQGLAKNVGTAWLDQLYAFLFGNRGPALTLLLDLPAETGLSRAISRGNEIESRFERMGLGYHQKIRDGFLDLAERYPDRIVTVDAAAEPATVHAAILKAINRRFGLALKPTL